MDWAPGPGAGGRIGRRCDASATRKTVQTPAAGRFRCCSVRNVPRTTGDCSSDRTTPARHAHEPDASARSPGDRTRVVSDKSVEVRVNSGGRSSRKKKKTATKHE